MAELTERSWSEAIGMYARRYTIAKVTSREHEDWALDVNTLLHGDTVDNRGWATKDSLSGELERLDDPYYPFALRPDDPATTGAWKSHLDEIPRASAERFLVALSTLWLNVEKEEDFEARRAGLEERAEVILSRFPDGSRFFANTGRHSKHLDYYKRIPGCDPISLHVWDLGLILVSETEVGMVWSFHAW